jgi:hypothetical protein
MKTAAKPALGNTQSIHFLPRWISHSGDETPDSVAFSSGAALAMLDVVLQGRGATEFAPLLRDRLALDAAAACLKLEGRADSLPNIRDAVCLARAGDALGPAGDMFAVWRKLARINLGVPSWRASVMKLMPGQVAEAMPVDDLRDGSPVAQAAQVLANLLQKFPRQEATALMLADVALAMFREALRRWT